MAEISICMITYNKAPFLERSVPVIFGSIADMDIVEFLLLDNGSTDGTGEVIDKLAKEYPIKTFHVPTNLGLNGYNYLARSAKGGMIVTADDDLFEVSYGWDRIFVKVLSSTFNGRRFGYVGGDVVNENGGLQGGTWGYAELGDIRVRMCPVGGWLASTTRNMMELVGGFHWGKPKMFLEDLDYQRRIWAAGYLCGIVENISLYHACAPEWYSKLGRKETYMEKVQNAREVGIYLG